ncbi:MAG: hypothetical protein ACPL7K_00875 [Armatimonadota bacterium]
MDAEVRQLRALIDQRIEGVRHEMAGQLNAVSRGMAELDAKMSRTAGEILNAMRTEMDALNQTVNAVPRIENMVLLQGRAIADMQRAFADLQRRFTDELTALLRRVTEAETRGVYN